MCGVPALPASDHAAIACHVLIESTRTHFAHFFCPRADQPDTASATTLPAPCQLLQLLPAAYIGRNLHHAIVAARDVTVVVGEEEIHCVSSFVVLLLSFGQVYYITLAAEVNHAY